MNQSKLYVSFAAIALAAMLSGCNPTSAPAGDNAGSSTNDTSATESTDTSTDTSTSESAADVILPGTGRYAIGTEAPYGGYELAGSPDSQPAGCTWSIQDADGAIQFENQGMFAFLTDVKENVTFVTDGCPDWEKFE
ncbi:hypothetical protein [uncultured Microbacterium sp.]|uniref:hypothetical protein n=1 Tax=uncultured Microbacterium sp. TaxID=191216 RepID=UPI0025D2CF8A|nr:hypothetical protein [uncultured Microbacterium sp.]